MLDNDDLSPEYLFSKSIEANKELAEATMKSNAEHHGIINRLKVLATDKLNEHYKQIKDWLSKADVSIEEGLSSFVQRNLFEGNGTFNDSYRPVSRKGLPYFNMCCNGGNKTETIINPYYVDKSQRYFKPEFKILKQTGLEGCCSNSILRVNQIKIHQPESKWSGIYNCIGIAKAPVFLSFYLKVLENYNVLQLPGIGIRFRRLWIDNIEHPVNSSATYIQDNEWHHIKIEAVYSGGHNCIYPIIKKAGHSTLTVQMAAYKIEQSKFYTPYSPI